MYQGSMFCMRPKIAGQSWYWGSKQQILSKKVANLDEKFVSDLPGGLILAKTRSRTF